MSAKIIIGSTAIKHWFPDFPRNPADIDYIVGVPDMWDKEKRVEYLENDVIYLNQDKYCIDGYITPNALYTLKISHAVQRNVNLPKHIWDIQWLKEQGCELDIELFDKLYVYWEDMFGRNKRSDLEMSAEDFFDNAIKYPIPHDDLHYILNTTPIFTKILKDGAEVEVDEKKFNLLSFEEKCKLVEEEVMVMAAERYESLGWQHGYSKMLEKFFISHAPLWEAIWMVQNWKAIHRPKFNYIQKIKEYGIQTVK